MTECGHEDALFSNEVSNEVGKAGEVHTAESAFSFTPMEGILSYCGANSF